jgi:hypothetical protein
VKRGRGRPSKASLAAAAAAAAAGNNESLSSLATSTYSSGDSVSGYSTPLTSNVTTPAPLDNAKSAPTRSTRSGTLDTASPAVKSRGSATASNSKANSQPATASSKANPRDRLAVVPDSEDHDLDDNESSNARTRYDEEVARSLQNELDREAGEFLSEDDAEEQSMLGSENEDYIAADPKGKGKAVAIRKTSGTRSAAKRRVIQDSDVDVDQDDQDDQDDDYSDFADLAPPPKKQKIAVRGRGKQAVAKGKQVAAPTASDSDDDLPRKFDEGTTPAFSPVSLRYAHYLRITSLPKDLSVPL